MAVTNDDFDRLRNELDVKIATVTVEQVNAATAISAYAERIAGIELRVDALANEMDRRFDAVHNEMNRRFDTVHNEMNRRFDAQTAEMNRRFELVDKRTERIEAKLDSRFGWQIVIMTGLGALILFDDAIRSALGF